MIEKKKECRICYNLDFKKKLLSPCKCIGSMKYVHKKCIEHFIETTENEYFETYCYVCNSKYDFISFKLSFIHYVCLFYALSIYLDFLFFLISFLFLLYFHLTLYLFLHPNKQINNIS